jgi:hypothetical protein
MSLYHRCARVILDQSHSRRVHAGIVPLIPVTIPRSAAALSTTASSPSSTSTSTYINVTPPSLLSRDVIRSIKQDLVEADVNGDGRICFEELKWMLHKHKHKHKYDSFSKQDIDEIGEMFFVGTSGQSLNHTTFLRGVQHAATQGDPQESPLQLESVDDQRCWVGKEDTHGALYNIQQEFDLQLLKYIEDKVEQISRDELELNEKLVLSRRSKFFCPE